MSSRANVRSLEAVQRFRPAVVRFQEEVAAAVGSLRQELNRSLDWVDQDRPFFWRLRVRACFDSVAAARTELLRKQIITVAGHRPTYVEEKQTLRREKRQLESAQEKVKLVRQWSIRAHRSADEYLLILGRIERLLAHDLSRTTALLDRIITALESYVSVDAPASAPVEQETNGAMQDGRKATVSSESEAEELM